MTKVRGGDGQNVKTTESIAFGRELVTWLDGRRISNADFARRAGLSETTVGRVKRGCLVSGDVERRVRAVMDGKDPNPPAVSDKPATRAEIDAAIVLLVRNGYTVGRAGTEDDNR